jgi:ribose-phosphate pyrophosphokinase
VPTLIPTSTTEHLAPKQNPEGVQAPYGAGKFATGQAKNIEVIFPNKNRDGKRYFPDGEIYMKIFKANRLRNKRAIVLHSGAPKPNEGLMELELILQILRDNDVRPEIFFSYFPYGMQDKVFEKGETNVAENLIEKLINYYKVKKIYVIDPHFGGRKWIKKYPLIDVSAIPILIEAAKGDFGEDILFLSPDIGGKRRTGISGGMKKERLTSFKVKMVSPELNFKGKVIGVIDDMIKTGGTLLKFQEIAKKSGAKKIIALVTHGVIPSGIQKVKKKYSKLYLTNTIKQKEANIDITELILKTISNHDRN